MTIHASDNLLAAMHTDAFGYARHMIFGARARANGREDLADLFEEIATTDYLGPFAEKAEQLGLAGSDAENLVAVKRETHRPDRRIALRTALANLRNPAPAGAAIRAGAGLPQADQDEVC